MLHDNGKVIPGLFSDDQALVLRTKQGLTVILGCASSGLINTIEYVLDHLKDQYFSATAGTSFNIE